MVIGTGNANQLKELLPANDSIKQLMEVKRGTGRIVFRDRDAAQFNQQTTVITATGAGFATTGVMPIERMPGVTACCRHFRLHPRRLKPAPRPKTR